MMGLRVGLKIATMIARAAAAHEGGFDGDETLTPIYTWITARDERVCPVCSPLDSKVYNLLEVEEISTRLGTVKIGEPVHPNCRCPRNSVLKYDKEERAQAYNKEDYFW